MARFALALALLLVAGVSACHSSSSSSTGEAPKVSEPPKNGRFVGDPKKGDICEFPLASYCVDQPCDSFSKATVAARALVSRTGIWGTVEIGACGSFNFIHRGVWYMHETEFFDGEKLVGAEVSVDNLTQFCDGKTGQAHYGNVPACTFAPTEIILDGGAP